MQHNTEFHKILPPNQTNISIQVSQQIHILLTLFGHSTPFVIFQKNLKYVSGALFSENDAGGQLFVFIFF